MIETRVPHLLYIAFFLVAISLLFFVLLFGQDQFFVKQPLRLGGGATQWHQDAPYCAVAGDQVVGVRAPFMYLGTLGTVEGNHPLRTL